jgi:biotin synthase-like enzyme
MLSSEGGVLSKAIDKKIEEEHWQGTGNKRVDEKQHKMVKEHYFGKFTFMSASVMQISHKLCAFCRLSAYYENNTIVSYIIL